MKPSIEVLRANVGKPCRMWDGEDIGTITAALDRWGRAVYQVEWPGPPMMATEVHPHSVVVL